MINYLSKFRKYRFFVYWLVTWLEYADRLQIIDEFENANYHRKKRLNILKENDLQKM